MKFRTLHKISTKYSADSVEWCTEDAAYFACGTYQLEETTEGEQKANALRVGCIYLYHFDNESGALEELQILETTAILDMKWLPHMQLVVATSAGQLEVHNLLLEKPHLQRTITWELEKETESTMALAFDWQTGVALEYCVTDTAGYISHVKALPNGKLQTFRHWKAHGYEAWTCAFDKFNSQVVYSGGDDQLLRAFDLRQAQPLWTCKEHRSSVTSLLSHPKTEHTLLSGSYDDCLRVFDTRNMKHSLAELPLGGGVWRIKPHTVYHDVILVACMYKNFSVVNFDTKSSKLSILGTYEEHTNICYGADWSPVVTETESGKKLLHMGTCSFYDRMLCVSSVQFDWPAA